MSDPKYHQVRNKQYKEKTGYDNPMQNPEIINERIKIDQEKYGVDYAIASKEIRIKSAKTNLEKYGVENPFYLKENRKKGGGISKEESKWLDTFQIPDENRNILLPGTTNIFVDGFDPDTNTVYEYYGSYWHGNPEIYLSEEYNERTKTTFDKLYQNTIEREHRIKKLGYILVVKWS